jgi:hypothetical protein
MGGALSRMGRRRDAYMVLVRESEGKRTLKRPRHRWEDTIKKEQEMRLVHGLH